MKIEYPTNEQVTVVNLVEYLTMFMARTIWQRTEILECLRDKIEDMAEEARLDPEDDAAEIQFYHDTIKFVEAQIEDAKKHDR